MCGHTFHLDCIGNTFNAASGRMQCPSCRSIQPGQWQCYYISPGGRSDGRVSPRAAAPTAVAAADAAVAMSSSHVANETQQRGAAAPSGSTSTAMPTLPYAIAAAAAAAVAAAMHGAIERQQAAEDDFEEPREANDSRQGGNPRARESFRPVGTSRDEEIDSETMGEDPEDGEPDSDEDDDDSEGSFESTDGEVDVNEDAFDELIDRNIRHFDASGTPLPSWYLHLLRESLPPPVDGVDAEIEESQFMWPPQWAATSSQNASFNSSADTVIERVAGPAGTSAVYAFARFPVVSTHSRTRICCDPATCPTPTKSDFPCPPSTIV